MKRNEVFNELFKRFSPRINLYCIRFLQDENEAEDTVQNCFVKLFTSNIDLKDSEYVKNYLYQVARNECLNKLRHNKLVTNYSLDEIDNFHNDEIIKIETYNKIHSSISLLPKQSQKIILLRLDGYKYPEIAELLNISINTVKTLKSLAFKKLKEALKDYFYTFIFVISSIKK